MTKSPNYQETTMNSHLVEAIAHSQIDDRHRAADVRRLTAQVPARQRAAVRPARVIRHRLGLRARMV
jgi:hypothetical protein